MNMGLLHSRSIQILMSKILDSAFHYHWHRGKHLKDLILWNIHNVSPAYQWTPPKRCNSLQIVHFLHINTHQPTQQSNWHLKIQNRVLSLDLCRLLVAKATPSLRRLPLLGWSSSFQQRVLSPRDPNNLPSFFSFLSADISRRELNNLARLLQSSTEQRSAPW